MLVFRAHSSPDPCCRRLFNHFRRFGRPQRKTVIYIAIVMSGMMSSLNNVSTLKTSVKITMTSCWHKKTIPSTQFDLQRLNQSLLWFSATFQSCPMLGSPLDKKIGVNTISLICTKIVSIDSSRIIPKMDFQKSWRHSPPPI